MAKAKVLLVEDDPLQARHAREVLERAGYEVVSAADGIEAIKVTKGVRPDIILLDLVLPGLDGYEVCRWLKLDEQTRGIPVIMLTVKKDLSDKVTGLQIGADDYLPKPFDEGELNARIYASLRTKALQDELKEKNRQLEDLLQKVEYMAITDVLTGLFNRRRFHNVMEKEFERARRYKTPFSLMLLDIDHFKAVNDSFGHSVGDGVLKDLANLIRGNVREVDTAARYGGEEFSVILPNTKKEDAVNVAERIRKSVEANRFGELGGRVVTVSIGISGAPDGPIDSEDKLVRVADYALYEAKRQGRNRTEMAEGKVLGMT